MVPDRELRLLLDALATASGAACRTQQPPRVGLARLFGLDALTVQARAFGMLEPLWQATDHGLGAAVDDLQYTLGEGPAHDALNTQAVVVAEDLAACPRWPVLRAHADRVAALIAIPLCLGALPLAVLNGYRARPGPFTPRDVDALHAFIRHTLRLYLHAPRRGEPLAPSYEAAADARRPRLLVNAEVHQATGMLAAQLGLPLDHALLRLRAHAFAHDRTLTDVAHDIVTHRLHLQ